MARQFNATPASPALRHQMVESLNGVMANAVKVGGTLMAFHLLRPRGVPMPMTLTVFRPVKPASMAAVIAANAGRDDAVTATHADGGAIVRRAGATSSRLDKDSEPVAQLQAEYWLDPQDGAGLYHAVFTTPLLEQSDALLEMFDAIVSTVRAA